jgi:hypothetical protein
MIGLFIIATPILLFGVVALLGFIGCDRVFGLETVVLPTAVTNFQSLIVQGDDAGNAQTAVSFSGSPKLIVVTLFYETGGSASLSVTGGAFQPPFKSDSWSSYVIESSYAANVPPGQNITVAATVSGQAGHRWYMCVSLYDQADPSNPVYSPNSANSIANGVIAPLTVNALAGDDLIYSVVAVQNSGASFLITGSLAVVSGPDAFQLEASNGPILVQDKQVTAPQTFSVSADTSGTNAGRWYILAAGIKHGSNG